MSHTVSRRALGMAGSAAALTAAAALLAQGSANADVVLRLPTQNQVTTLPDGTSVTIARTSESAIIAPSLGATPLHRAAQVSAQYQVTTSKKAKIRIQAGYVVGCQVNIASFPSVGGSVSEGFTDKAGTTTSVGNAAGSVGSITLAPGQATSYFINQVEKADDFGSQKYTNNVDYEST